MNEIIINDVLFQVNDAQNEIISNNDMVEARLLRATLCVINDNTFYNIKTYDNNSGVINTFKACIRLGNTKYRRGFFHTAFEIFNRVDVSIEKLENRINENN